MKVYLLTGTYTTLHGGDTHVFEVVDNEDLAKEYVQLRNMLEKLPGVLEPWHFYYVEKEVKSSIDWNKFRTDKNKEVET